MDSAPTPEGSNWWLDEPLVDVRADTLGRLPFAQRVVRVLDSLSGSPSSTVLGLVGAWGSGKTSTLNLITSQLDRERWSLAHINPWAVATPEATIADLMTSIRGALPERDSRARTARESLERYGRVVTPLLSLLPVVGGAAKELSQAALDHLADDTPLQQRAAEAGLALENLARPVLVVVDDVDRLQPDELLALFKGVRALGRLPYVHYLLAYDERTVLDVLKATAIAPGREDRALAFLEKMVTLRLDQPPLGPAQAARSSAHRHLGNLR